MRPLRAEAHSIQSPRAASAYTAGMSIRSRLRSLFLGDEVDTPARLPSPDEIVVLTRPNGEPEGLMLQEILASNGIRAMLRNRDAASAQSGGAPGAWWAYELCVLRRDLRRAREIVGEPGA